MCLKTHIYYYALLVDSCLIICSIRFTFLDFSNDSGGKTVFLGRDQTETKEIGTRIIRKPGTKETVCLLRSHVSLCFSILVSCDMCDLLCVFSLDLSVLNERSLSLSVITILSLSESLLYVLSCMFSLVSQRISVITSVRISSITLLTICHCVCYAYVFAVRCSCHVYSLSLFLMQLLSCSSPHAVPLMQSLSCIPMHPRRCTK